MTMSVILKRLSIDDYQEIINLWAAAGLPFKPKGRDSWAMMAKEMQQEGVAYFGIYEENNLLAVGIANYDGRRGWINRVAVDPDRRGQGLAGMIIEECEKFMRSRGAVVMTALIEEINEPSISCFQKAGFICDRSWLYFSKRDSKDL